MCLNFRERKTYKFSNTKCKLAETAASGLRPYKKLVQEQIHFPLYKYKNCFLTNVKTSLIYSIKLQIVEAFEISFLFQTVTVDLYLLCL